MTIIRINWDHWWTQWKRICSTHVNICTKRSAEDVTLLSSTWMLQEISESSSSRIVQRTSWSKERLLGLRNRSIFILVLIRFQLLASADAQPVQKHAGSVHARTHIYASFDSLFWGGEWMNGSSNGWMGRRMMDATETASTHLLPVHWSRCAFTFSLSLPPSLSLALSFYTLRHFLSSIKCKNNLLMFVCYTLK